MCERCWPIVSRSDAFLLSARVYNTVGTQESVENGNHVGANDHRRQMCNPLKPTRTVTHTCPLRVLVIQCLVHIKHIWCMRVVMQVHLRIRAPRTLEGCVGMLVGPATGHRRLAVIFLL